MTRKIVKRSTFFGARTTLTLANMQKIGNVFLGICHFGNNLPCTPPLRQTPGPAAAAVLVTEFECPDCAKRFQSELQPAAEGRGWRKSRLSVAGVLVSGVESKNKDVENYVYLNKQYEIIYIESVLFSISNTLCLSP